MKLLIFLFFLPITCWSQDGAAIVDGKAFEWKFKETIEGADFHTDLYTMYINKARLPQGYCINLERSVFANTQSFSGKKYLIKRYAISIPLGGFEFEGGQYAIRQSEDDRFLLYDSFKYEIDWRMGEHIFETNSETEAIRYLIKHAITKTYGK